MEPPIGAPWFRGGRGARCSRLPPLQRSTVKAPSEAWRFLQGESPCGVRINHPLLPSVATATAEVETPNKSVEAYTGKHAGRRRDRDLQSLIQPRHGV